MSTYPALYNGELPTLFNPNDFYTTEYIQSLETALLNSTNLKSTSLVSSAISVLNTDGTTSSTATEPWVTTQINNAVSTLTGGSLQNTLATLPQIDQAINNDPNFYTDITTSIATVQNNVNTNSSAITALQNRATTDETNITNLQNTKLNANNGNSTGTLYAQNLNLTGTFTTGNISANGATVTPAQISYLGNVTSDIQGQINGKASSSSPTFTGTVSLPSTVDNGSFTANNDLTVSSGTVSFPNNSISQNAINNLSSTLSNLAPINNASLTGNPTVPTQSTSDNSTKIASTAYVQNNLANYETTSALTSTLSNYATKSSPSFTGTVILPSVTDNGNATLNGTTTFTQNLIANSTNITPTQLSYISGLTSNAQTQITSNTNNITTNTNSISSINTTLAGKQNTLTFDTTPTSSSTNPVTSGGIYSTLQNYETTSALTSTLANYATTASLSNYETTSALTTTLSNYATTSSLSSYAPINNSNLTGITTVNEISEQVYNASSGTNLSLTYTSIKGIIYYSPSANFTLTLTSVPTSSTTETYSLTFIYNTKYYCNAISVNGTTYTMIAGGGLSNISINSSASYVMQQISICFLNSSTPIVVTNVLSLF